ncbi:MAG: DUF1905 domain-containing protein [Halobacteriovoraceae bacterium]|nr:DUF1905 domain-containing protein [Halobacteriovoraceae bacterium]
MASVWKHEGPNSWYFANVPKSKSKIIRNIHKNSEEGWGRLKSLVSIGELTWKTSIWFDTKHNCYLVPIKLSIRKKEGITDGTKVKIKITFFKN